MERKSIKLNYLFILIYKVMNVIAPLITAPYIARVLGVDGVGQVSYAESIVSYFVLFAAMGIPTYGQREISYVQDSKEERTRVFWNTYTLGIIMSLGISLMYAFFAFIKGSVLYAVLSFLLIAVMVDITWFFQGIEEFGKIASRSIFIRISNIIFLFTAVKSKNDVLFYVFGITFFPFLGNLTMWGYLKKYIGKPNWRDIHPFHDIKTVISLFVPTIAIQVYTVFDKTMIGLITHSDLQNGYYEQASKITKIIISMITALGAVMTPRVGYYLTNKSKEEAINLILKGYNFIWFLGMPIFFGLIVVSPFFVPWFFGDGYDEVIVLLQVLSLLVLSIALSNMTGCQYLITTNQQKLLTLSVIIGAATNFLLNIVLIFNLQALGASIASVIAEMVVTIVQFVLLRKQLPILRIFALAKNYFLSGLAMGIVVFGIGKFLKATIINTIILVLVGISIYFGSLLFLRDSFFTTQAKQIMNKITKR